MTGHDYRRYAFEKRTFRNQYLGPFVNHEMNRCIQCYRCVRFYREYAGGRRFECFGLRNIVYFGRDRMACWRTSSAGNLVEVCPTGVFTDNTLKRHYTRKWDMQMAPSVCVHCGLGCNITAAERYGMLRRIVNRYNREVNGYFLCDRGRYGYEFVNSERRIRQPVSPAARIATAEGALILCADLRRGRRSESARRGLRSKSTSRCERWWGRTGSMPAYPTTDSRLLQLMLEILRNGPAHSPSLHEIESVRCCVHPGRRCHQRRTANGTEPAPVRSAAAHADRRQLHIPLWMDHGVREALQDAKGPAIYCQHPRQRAWTTSPPAPIAAHPTIWRGLALPSHMRWIHVRLRHQTCRSDARAGGGNRPGTEESQAATRHLRPEQSQRGSHPGSGECGAGHCRASSLRIHRAGVQ